MKEYFIAKNVTNIMTKPDSSSELDSQVIAGTIVSLEKTENGYYFVRTPDHYQGWVSKLRLVEAWDTSDYKKVCIKTLFANVYPKPDEKTYPLTRLVISTCLPISNDYENASYVEIILPDKQKGYVQKICTEPWDLSMSNISLLEKKWQEYKNDEREKIIIQLGEKIIDKAKRLIGTPYLWGGNTSFGIDCSGLTQLIYKLNGIQLLRNSYMQYDDKRFVKIEIDKPLDEALFQAGDLLIFDTTIPKRPKINHIGVACGDGTFIEASGHARGGGVILSQCTNDFLKQAFMGAVRLSSKVEINIAAAEMDSTSILS